MKYNFMWSAPSAGAPIVSIATYGITFNSTTIEILKNPERIKMGFDDKQKVIGIMPTTDENDLRSFEFKKKEKNNYARIGNKDFVKYISNKTGLDFKAAKKFIPEWDEDDQILIVRLSEPLDDTNDISDEQADEE